MTARVEMLRDLSFSGLSGGFTSSLQRRDEVLEVAITADLPEAAYDFDQRRADPALEHRPVTPALDVAQVPRREAVEVLDRVGGSERFVERPVHAQAGKRERLIEPFADRAGRTWMRALQGTESARSVQVCERVWEINVNSFITVDLMTPVKVSAPGDRFALIVANLKQRGSAKPRTRKILSSTVAAVSEQAYADGARH